MQKYQLKGLDCANCALKIEDSLKLMESVRGVSVNFATATLAIDTDDIAAVRGCIQKIEPDVVLVEPQGKAYKDNQEDAYSHSGEFSIRQELLRIGAATVLLIVGLAMKESLHNTPYAAAEHIVFGVAYLLSGWGVLTSAGRNILRRQFFDETFLMTVATLGAAAIHEWPEAVGVMLFYKVGEFFQDMSVSRSRRSIQSLLEIRPDHANLRENGDIVQVTPESVRVDDHILVKPGEKIPLDGEVLEGSSQVDTSALTGEPIPRMANPGDALLAGMINKTGSLTLRVTRPFEESSVSKILELVENASSRKATTEKFITKFARYYTPVVVLGALAVALLPPLLVGASFSTWIYRALVLLVISCPCALVISIPLGYFGGVGGASRKGILVKGANFLDALSSVKTVIFDKTGTLTQGVFKVTQLVPRNGFNEQELLRLAAEAESQSNHPIAQSIREAYGHSINPSLIEEVKEIPGRGIRAKVEGRWMLAGNDALLHQEGIEHDVCDVDGTVVHLAVDGVYAGYVLIEDELKPDAADAVQTLSSLGVKRTVMLTGDSEAAASRVARKLGLDAYHAELLPEGKLAIMEELMLQSEERDRIAFVGDGINDAPVIARADVGIAMGAMGSDAAIDTADVVLMTDAPSKVAEAIRVGRKTRRIVWQNIGLAFAVKLAFILLGVVGFATMWEAVFADVGVALLAVFNATRALR